MSAKKNHGRPSNTVNGIRKCNKCLKGLPESDFYTLTDRRDGKLYLQARCKECQKKHNQRPHNSKYWLKYKYGITEEQYNDILSFQGGGCAICNDTYRLSVDHDHETGVVRGILCGRCNPMLGLAKDKVDTLYSAMQYLMETR